MAAQDAITGAHSAIRPSDLCCAIARSAAVTGLRGCACSPSATVEASFGTNRIDRGLTSTRDLVSSRNREERRPVYDYVLRPGTEDLVMSLQATLALSRRDIVKILPKRVHVLSRASAPTFIEAKRMRKRSVTGLRLLGVV